MPNQIVIGRLSVSLTADRDVLAHYGITEESGKPMQYLLEVTELDEDGEGTTNDAAHSGLPLTATPQQVLNYLQAAMAEAQRLVGPKINVKGVASRAATEGRETVL